MKKLIYILFFFPLFSAAQSNLSPQIADSLWQVWQDKTQPDTNRLKAIAYFAWEGYVYTQPDSAFYYAQLHYNFAKARGLKKQMSDALNTQGVSFHIQGDYAKAIDYYTRSLKIDEEIGDKKRISPSLNNIGNVYSDQGDYTKAIDYYTRSLKINEEIGNKRGISTSLNNIGIIYYNQGDCAKAIDYYTRSLKIYDEIGVKQGAAHSLNNIGIIYGHQGDYAKAIDYYTRSLKIHNEIGDKKGMASSLHNIGETYDAQGDYIKAIDYYTRSLKIREEIGDKLGIASSLNNLGILYKEQGDYIKAIDYYTRSLQLFEEIGYKQGIALALNNVGNIYKDRNDYAKALDFNLRALRVAQEVGAIIEIRDAAKSLWEINKKTGQYRQSIEMHELYVQMRDSILSEENQKEVIRQEYKYIYEKQAAADSVSFAKEQEIKEVEIARQQAEIKARKNQQYALFGGLFLVGAFAGVIYNRLKVTHRQKGIIEEKERETYAQKQIIEEKHKEITDSINYAERIQRSFLATREILDEHLRDYFVFFKPKDVVSGDFYWASQLKNGNFAFCCADSTGHGVPGAIMSILNISSLEKSIEVESTPDKILNETRKIIIKRLKKDGTPEGGKDGMDCSLLALSQDKTRLTFASAHNPVFIVRAVTSGSGEGGVSRSETHELLEFKPDKMPVGKHDKDQESFTLQTVQLQKGDVIYTLTDGFPDQFGGDKGKKFKTSQLKELLLSIQDKTMEEQKEFLDQAFEDWRGNLEQIDDVCIIGVRV
ncbi:MAG: tetratricopeptide repeat protein [Flavobacteriales bacterium]